MIEVPNFGRAGHEQDCDHLFAVVTDLSMGRTNSLATLEGPTLWKSLELVLVVISRGI